MTFDSIIFKKKNGCILLAFKKPVLNLLLSDYTLEVNGLPLVDVESSAFNLCQDDNDIIIEIAISLLTFPVNDLALLWRGSGRLVMFSNFYPKDDYHYENNFIREAQRSGNSLIDFFNSYQIVKFFKGSNYYTCGAQVVKSYKAIELEDKTFIADALDSMRSIVNLTKSIDYDWHPRRNGEHLFFSTSCADWHMSLAIGDYNGTFYKLKAVFDNVSILRNYFTPSYPISLSILMYIIFLTRRGRIDEARVALEKLVYVFKRAVEDCDNKKIVLFSELAVPHKATILASKLLESSVCEGDILKECFKFSLRVKAKDIVDNIYQHFIKKY